MPTTATQALTAAGQNAALAKPVHDNITFAMLYGTYTVAAGRFEGSFDGSTWFPVYSQSLSLGSAVTGNFSLADSSTTGYRIDSEGLTNIRFWVTAIATGTLNCKLQSDDVSTHGQVV